MGKEISNKPHSLIIYTVKELGEGGGNCFIIYGNRYKVDSYTCEGSKFKCYIQWCNYFVAQGKEDKC